MRGDRTFQLPGQMREGCVALIAVNLRVRCKSRLSVSLEAVDRLKLVRKMLLQVLDAARYSSTVGQIVVVSPERDELPPEVPVLADSGSGLNEALSQAQAIFHSSGLREMLVLPADLPLVQPADIDKVVRAGRRTGFAIAPDAANSGTNALYLRAQSPFRFQFGIDSKARHLAEAERLGWTARVVHVPGMAFDVDLPADLLQLEPWQWSQRRPA